MRAPHHRHTTTVVILRSSYDGRHTIVVILCHLTYPSLGEHIDIPPPTILKPVALWTGKQIISLLVKPRRTPANGEPPVLANLTLKERNYTDGGPLCRNDGYVIFRNSELLCGNLAKKTLGDGTKKGLFYVLLRDHGAAEAARCMNRLAKLVARYLGGHKVRD